MKIKVTLIGILQKHLIYNNQFMIIPDTIDTKYNGKYTFAKIFAIYLSN